MVEYTVKLMPRAARNIDNIYKHIAQNIKMTKTALNLVNSLENAILKLNRFPYRGSIRRTGIFANLRFRQVFVKNFTIIYRIEEENKTVIIVTVRYSPSKF